MDSAGNTFYLDGTDDGGEIEATTPEAMIVALETRPFLTTPLEDYSVTEGLLLMIMMAFVIAALYQLVRRYI